MSSDHVDAFLKDSKSYFRACVRNYENQRYLRNVSVVGLDSRANAIARNLWTTDASGAVVQPSEPGPRELYLRLYVELLAEQRLRGRGRVIEIDEAAVRARASAAYTPPRLITAIPRLAPGALVRFGKCVHLDDALREGILQISPASTYNDPSLNGAQFDDELRHHAVTPNEQLAFKAYGRRTPDGPEEELSVTPLELYRYMDVSPFYVLCLSSRFDFRMFHDFEVDAAIVIHEPWEFERRVNTAMARAVDAEPDTGAAEYYDPYQVRREQLIPMFSKNFRYAYQHEVRMIWRPKSGITRGPVFVKAGPLGDIAELVRTA